MGDGCAMGGEGRKIATETPDEFASSVGYRGEKRIKFAEHPVKAHHCLLVLAVR